MANTLAYYIDKLVIYNIMGFNSLDFDDDYIEKSFIGLSHVGHYSLNL
jgi:hypothetical protein